MGSDRSASDRTDVPAWEPEPFELPILIPRDPLPRDEDSVDANDRPSDLPQGRVIVIDLCLSE